MPLTQVQTSMLGTGAVLQVVQGVITTIFSTTSTSYVATTLNASITPKFSTSKILAIVSGSITNTTGSAAAFPTIYRNSTNLGAGSNSALNQYVNNASSYNFVPLNMIYLDSPATTSSTTYTVYLKASSGTAYFSDVTHSSTITLMEIAA